MGKLHRTGLHGFEIFGAPIKRWTTIRSTAVPDSALALLDTSCVIDFPDQLDKLDDAAAVSTLTVAELAYGLHHDDPLVAAVREAATARS